MYPSFYTTLPANLRNRLQRIALTARNKGLGLWPSDATNGNPLVRGLADLESIAIWPKLYRRLFAYFQSGKGSLTGFDRWLRADPKRDDELRIGSQARVGRIHDVVTVNQNRITMNFDPADLVIVPR